MKRKALSIGLILILMAAMLSTTPVLAASAITVCASGCDYPTIQAAVNNAGPSDEIIVGDGTFAEGVNLNNVGSVGQTQAVGPEAVEATRLSDLPLSLQYTVSEAMGRNQSAYHPERQPNGFRAATPTQGYTTHFGVEGMTLTAGQSRLQMQLTGMGYGERLTPVAAALPTSGDNRIEYQRGNVTEWYVNGPLGLQQGFTLEERPERSGFQSRSGREEQSLALALAVSGGWQAEVSAGGRDLSLTAGDGTSLRYGGLLVYDATGQELPARFRLNPESKIVYILINDSAAIYPLTIAPFFQQAYLKASNIDGGDFFGHSVAISGDTVVVGAYLEDSNGTGGESDNSALHAGAAYVFVRSGATWSQQAYLKASNAGFGDLFGWSVAISGDTVVVGAYGESSNGTGGESDDSAPHAGAAYVYLRSGATWSQQAYLKASNAEPEDWFGHYYSVAVSGDTVVVGAWGEDGNGTGGESDNSAPAAGAAYVFGPEATTGTIIVEKQTDPDGAPDLFDFSGDAAGSIADGGQIVVSDLPPGDYTSTETVPPGWNLTAITCDDDNSSGDLGTQTATFRLEPGETVKCTFNNKEEPAAISLASFTAEANDGRVMLLWETATEIDNAGFNLYRATSPDGPWVKLNSALIAAEGDAVAGASYTFADAPGWGTFCYQLEDVDYFGVSTLHGPVSVELGSPVRAPRFRPTLPEF